MVHGTLRALPPKKTTHLGKQGVAYEQGNKQQVGTCKQWLYLFGIFFFSLTASTLEHLWRIPIAGGYPDPWTIVDHCPTFPLNRTLLYSTTAIS